MQFNSIDFLVFLPVVFLLYQACRSRHSQNAVIVLSSYFFYGCWDPRFLGLITFTTLCSYLCGLALDRQGCGRRSRRALLTANIVVNMGILAVFKYYNFFMPGLVELLGHFGWRLDWATVKVLLPVGISFYTFQAVGYTIDVYRRDIRAERGLVTFFAFISFFPQLVAGPVERAHNMLPQFHAKRSFDYAAAVDGMRQMLWGFFKKLVIADKCAFTTDTVFDDPSSWNSPTLVYALVLFAFQVYADFSGYSDIAIGSAKLFGIRLTRNFNCPYFATSIAEFWRRWHISMMTWLRDYVYIPLGGSRRGKARRALNVLIIFLISGIWHGGGWCFIVWGVYNAVVMTPRVLLGVKERAVEAMSAVEVVARRLWTFVLFMVGLLFIRSDTVPDALGYLTGIFTHGGTRLLLIDAIVVGFIVVMMLTEYWRRRCEHGLQIGSGVIKSAAVRVLIYFLIMIAIFWQGGHSTQFIYFQF